MPKRKPVETSLEAYRALQPEQLRQTYKDILFALSQLGEATSAEIAKALHVKHEKIWKRPSELSRMGLIYRPGTKRPMPGGKLGYTWKLTQPGQSIEPVIEKSLPGESVADFSRKLIPQQQQLF